MAVTDEIPNTSAGKVIKSFKALGLSPEICDACDKLRWRRPTLIQSSTIPLAMMGRDIIAVGRTGSGKTGAFTIPVVHRLEKHSEIIGARAIVLSPTRELAMQTCKVFQTLALQSGLRIALIVGGHSMDGQFDRLMNNPDIIIATPGRLVHHLEQGGLTLARVEMMILDEADRLFELGFSDQIKDVLKSCPAGRQVLLFSATLPARVVQFAKAGLHSPEFVKLDSECTLSPDLSVSVAFTRNESKPAALISVLRSLRRDPHNIKSVQKTIVFAATRHHVDFLAQLIAKSQTAICTAIYGSMEQFVRTASLLSFRNGESQVLVVTDVAARGLDIPDVDNVIHYDFPCYPKLFIHRAGRTARNGKSGACISIVTQTDMPYLMDLVEFVGGDLVNLFAKKDVPETVVPEFKDSDDLLVEVDMGDEEPVIPLRVIEIGAIPYVDEDVEMIRRMIVDDSELESAEKSMNFSLGPYFKTRPSASKESVWKSHQFVNETCGGSQKLLATPLSMFASIAPAFVGDVGRDEILSSLRTFRPTYSTIGNSVVKSDTRKALEERVYGGKRAVELATQILVNSHKDEEEEVIVPERAAKPARSFKSKAFYHEATKTGPGETDSFEQHQFDLVPETNEEMAKARYAKKWDSRKMNYVSVKIGADGKAIKEKRNESGQKMTKKDLEKGKNLYKEWMKKTKQRIPMAGDIEEVSSATKTELRRDSWKPEEKKQAIVTPVTPKAVESKKYHGSVPWTNLTNKQKRLETRKLKDNGVTSRGTEKRADTLKSGDAIAKTRKLKENRQTLQNPKKRQEFHKASKAEYAKKQASKVQQRAAPNKHGKKAKMSGGKKKY